MLSLIPNDTIIINCPIWEFDDITSCARISLFETNIPLSIFIVSLSVIIITTLINYIKSKQKNFNNDEYQPLLNGIDNDNDNDINYTQDLTITNLTEKIKKSHLDLTALPPIKANGEPLGYEKFINRSIGEKLRVVLEIWLILFEIGLNFFKFNYIKYEFNKLTILTNLLIWSWLLILTSIRILNLNQNFDKIIPNLWINNFIIYLILVFTKVLVFRSALINHTNAKSIYILDFISLIILFINLLTSKIRFNNSKIFIVDEKTQFATEPITSIFGLITFSWINPMLWKSHYETLKFEDVWELKLDDFSYFVIKDFKKFSQNYSNWKFSTRLIWFFKKFLLLQCIWSITESLILFTPALILRKVLEFVDDKSTATLSLAWFYVLSMFFFKFISVVASGQALFTGRRVCIRLKSIIISEIYSKALRRKTSQDDKPDNEGGKKVEQETNKGDELKLDDGEKTSANLGAIINLMAVDAFKISEVCAYIHAIVGSIVMIIIAIALLYNLLGWSALVGAFSILILSPINFLLVKWLGDLQKKTLKFTDKRIQKLNETLQSIRIIKFFAWENKFIKEILEIRKFELYYIKLRSIVWTLSAFIWFITPTIVTFISFSIYIFVSKKQLTTPIAFTALSLFNLLRTPLDQLSDMLSFAIQSKVSLDRVEEFLNEEETTKYEQLTEHPNSDKIGFKNASFSWKLNSEVDFKLKDLNVEFKPKKLNVIIGPTGSGKTSLLMALLGEMTKLNGSIYLPGYKAYEELIIGEDGFTESVAYCSQSAWLLNDTIKNNIIFGSPFNKTRYQAVVEACGLSRDFEILKAGDQTEIGEKGIALSGGQKQRVSLARALYSNSRTVLLDDCLSAVDSHTALHIYENCISGPLMVNRTVLLVSHNVALTVKSAEFVVIMNNGKIINQGAPEELLLAGAFGDDEMIKSSVQSRVNSSVNLQSISETNNVSQTLSQKLQKQKLVTNDVINDEEEEELENLKKGKLIEEETKSDGVVSKDVYYWFCQLLGGFPVILAIILGFFTTQSITIGQSWWVRKWAQDLNAESFAINSVMNNTYLKYVIDLQYAVRTELSILKESNSSVYYIIIYASLGFAYAGISCFRILYVYFVGIVASGRVFELTLDKVMKAKLRFFDSTPIGRIINRFSKDLESVDQDLIPVADGAFGCLVIVVFTLALISSIAPGFLIFAFLISALYFSIGSYYLSSSRELKRYDSITKSPIHQHFSETLVGVSTIRAYGIERRFLIDNINRIDTNNKPFFYMWVANRWLSTRNDLVGALVVLFTGAFILLRIDSLDAGLAGIALSYAISFNEAALWVVRLYSQVEMGMNSLERLKEYLDIDEEPADYVPENEPPVNWPDEGRLEVNDLSLRYAPHLPKVIKNVTFNVEPNNKIGIVGRTGAGKSTIITALFRFLDPETGYIKIDNIDITSIGLKNLRQAITIIPQDPTLFTGTIKSNLDPFDRYKDDEIFEALRRVNLITREELQSQEIVSDDENINKFLNLTNEITEGGGNLSQGQRQLMCLARSLLKSPKIMLLDEATASIDYESDAKIQQTIRQEFANSTILTIAHRLRSIIDYDKILVMDSGEVIEFDHPFNLISNPKSIFYSMCKDSGELEILKQLSKESFDLVK
ncbi:hypothetical protein WICMUC_005441 [Wickerhamomyces mucosus]|uniref:ATP-dependent bile acid permease n=1 Tax=Wickerhamomyces mucosus TaxID=1378264 RepID=A0A9P8P9E3_9ASCO|nr:hypothetical protein WICMUC_005441 [Wickerhamomyces mucosus]